jgi:two-component system nitrogen regulation sensor histidine kinase NtrY
MSAELLPSPPLETPSTSRPSPDPPRAEWPRLWLVTAWLALAALATWQRNPGWPMLMLSLAATVASAWFVHTVRTPRIWAIGTVAALAVGLAMGAQEAITLNKIAAHWPEYAESQRSLRATRVAARMNEIAPTLMTAAVEAVDRAGIAGDSIQLKLPETGRTESALVLFTDGRPVSHVGQTHVPLTPGPPGMSLVRTPFYTAVVARATGNDKRHQAVAAALLSSAPPADRFTRSLVQDVISNGDPAEVEILPPNDALAPVDAAERRVNSGASGFARIVVTIPTQAISSELALQHALVRTSIPLAIAAVLILVTSWRRPARTRERLFVVVALLAAVALVPLGNLSNVSGVFDPSNYFVALGFRLTANVAALILTSALSLCGLFLVLRSPKLAYPRRVAVLIVLVTAVAGPFAIRALARGITLSPNGASTRLWMAWQLALALSGASILLLGISAGQVAMGKHRGLPSWIAPAIACSAALLAVPLWQAPGTWPTWYPLLWIVAVAALAFVRRSFALVVGVAMVAGSGAVTLTWAANVRTRMHLAEVDVSRLAAVDDDARRFLDEFAHDLHDEVDTPREADALLRRYAISDLSAAGYGARIARWIPGSPKTPVTVVSLVTVTDSMDTQSGMAALARQSGNIELRSVQNGAFAMLVAAIPYSDGSVTTVMVPPKTNLASRDTYAALTGLATGFVREPPYSLMLEPRYDAAHAPAAIEPALDHVIWRRRGNIMHGDGFTAAQWPAHVEVALRRVDAMVPRGALLVLFDTAIVAMLWALSAMADGGVWRWFWQRGKVWSRSYRVRISLALLMFFVVPATAFAAWATYRLREDDRSARELAVREALRVAAVAPNLSALAQASADVGAPLYLYRDGQLAAASSPVLESLAPIGRLLSRNLDDMLGSGPDADDFEALTIPTGQTSALVGFRRVRLEQGKTVDSTYSQAQSAIVATLARGDEFALDERSADLVVQVLLVMSLGAIAAIWLSGVAAGARARPVGSLRRAALAVASGQRELHLAASPVTEFAPVFAAFTRMADDLSTSRNALEAAQRRTEAVLQNVASGVLAVRGDGSTLIANPRAEAMLGIDLRDNALDAAGPPELVALLVKLRAFLSSTDADDAFVGTIKGRQLNARLTRLPGGAVLTLDDVTDLASAQRVLAWGEMARQVAHEIKNPLTPIRLGVQHLRRAYRDKRADFSKILETNVGRVLEEIDHLDEIARSFSRYGTAPAERAAPQEVSLGDVVRDVIALESLGDSGVNWTLNVNVDEGADRAWARVDELKEVLVNLMENARLAAAHNVQVRFDRSDKEVCIEVTDDGGGIPADVLPRIFEPHFSTRTSGSGLGLAISRRLIESWGGSVHVESVVGAGTTVQIKLRAASQVPG